MCSLPEEEEEGINASSLIRICWGFFNAHVNIPTDIPTEVTQQSCFLEKAC